MAGPDKETRFALAGGSPTESSIAKRTGPVRDEEMIDLDGCPLEEEEEEEEDDEEFDDEHEEDASDEDSEEESDEVLETEAADEDEWGFGEKKPRFSKEVIVGSVAVALLCSVFGVVVFKNLSGDGAEEKISEGPSAGESGTTGSKGSIDPFTDDGKIKVAEHTARPGETSKPGDQNSLTAAGTGDDMGSLQNGGETGTGIGELQGEPAVEEGTNGTTLRLDPFGQPLAATDGSVGSAELTEMEQPGFETGIGEKSLRAAGVGEGNPFGSETGVMTETSQTTGLFQPIESPENAVGIESGEIKPFATAESQPRIDEFGRPVDPFGRPLATSTEGSESNGKSGEPFAETGSGRIESTGVGESSAGIGESIPATGETLTGLFPGETIRKPAGIGSAKPRIGETGISSGTPGFETTTETASPDSNDFFPPEQPSTGTGTLPRESTFPSDTASTGLLPETGTVESPAGPRFGAGNVETGIERTETLPEIGGLKSGPFDSTASTTIVGGYPVQEGDSYWTISRKVYGTARYFRVLAEYNSNVIPDPAKLRPGMTIGTPEEAVLKQMLLANSSDSVGSAESARPAGAPPATPQQGVFFDEQNQPRYRVGRDDTLTTIAADHLGRWARWRQIFEMNRDQLDNPNKLQIGMVLKLPADATRTAMSQRDEQIR